MIEIWKTLPGYEGVYKISNTGKVMSFAKNREGLLRKPHLDKNGYVIIKLQYNNISKMAKLHRLLAESFILNPYNYPLVLHNDDNPKNNCLSNLRWGTIKDNASDRNDRRRHCTGEKHSMSKILNKEIFEIRYLLSLNYTQKEIAELYKVTRSIIWRIKNNKSRQHI